MTAIAAKASRAVRALASDVDQPVDILVRALTSLHSSTRRLRAEQSVALGVSPSELDALIRIGNDGVVTPTELANALRITTSATTAVIDRLASAGLVARERSTRDRRSVLLSLTGTGAIQLDWIRTEYRRAVEEAVRRESHPLDAATWGLLAALTEVIDELADTPLAREQPSRG